jgi:hypothetical protein
VIVSNTIRVMVFFRRIVALDMIFSSELMQIMIDKCVNNVEEL